MAALSSLQTKNNKRKSSRFGSGWIIPLLSVKRRGKSGDALGAATTTKNYAGRHDQYMHTTLFNLANPSQGRDGSGRDKQDEETRGYANAPQAATSGTIGAVAVDPQPTDNSAIYRGSFTAETLATDESRYLSDLPDALKTELSYASALAIRTAAISYIKGADKADIKTYQDYLTRIYNAQLSGRMFINPATGIVTPKTQTSTFEQLEKNTRPRQDSSDRSQLKHVPPEEVADKLAFDALQLSVAGKWTEAHERGRLALVKADNEVKEQINRMPAIVARARERWGDELGVAIRLSREAQDVKAYATLSGRKLNQLLDNVNNEGNPYKSSSDFWKLHEQIGSRLLASERITPQEERGRLLFLSKGKELDRVTVEHFSELMRASTMAHNIEARVLAQIMSEDRIISGWVTQTSQAGRNGGSYRGDAEHTRLGYERGNMLNDAKNQNITDGALRPVYGYMQIKNLQDIAHESLQGKYGHVTATLRPAITPRVTATPQDSLQGTVRAGGRVPFVPLDALRAGDPKSVRAFISNHVDSNNSRGGDNTSRQVNWVAVLADARERGDRMKVSYKLEHQAYIETQMHSGLKPSRDISKLTVNVYDYSKVRLSRTTEDSLRFMKDNVESLGKNGQNDAAKQQSPLLGLQIALKRGIPVNVLEASTGMEVPLIKVGGQRGLYSQSEWESVLQTAQAMYKELRAYKTKNNKRKPSRFGGGWIIPLLSVKRRGKSGDALGAVTTTKNYAGRHDQYMHTTLFNLANPSQGRDGRGRDEQDEGARAYAGAPVAVASGVALAGTEAQPSVNVGLLLDRASLLQQEAFDDYYNGASGIWSVIPLTLGNTDKLSQTLAVDEIRNRALGSTYNVDFKYGTPSPKGQNYLDTQAWLEYKNVGSYLRIPITAQQERGKDILTKEMGRIAEMVKGDVNADSLSRSSQVKFKELVRAIKENEDVNAYKEFVFAKTTTVRKLQEEKDYLDEVISKIERGISVPQTRPPDWAGRREETGLAAENPRNTSEYRQLITNLAAVKSVQFPAMVSHTSNFWDAQARAVLDLTPQQQRGREIFEKNGREADTLLRTHLEKLIDAAPLRINMTLENLPKALNSDSYKSAFEVTGTTAAGGRGLQKGSEQGGTTSSGSNRGLRMAAEKKFYGITESSSPTESPIYAYLGMKHFDRAAGKGLRNPDTGEPYQGLQNSENISHLYGKVTLNLRPAVRDRATMTPDDSIALLGQSSAAVPLRGSGKGISPQFLAGRGMAQEAYKSAKAESKKIEVPSQYVEGQIFGGVKISRDVESVSIFVPNFSGDKIRRDMNLGDGNRPRSTQDIIDGISRAKSVFNTTAFTQALTSFVSKGVPVEIIASQTGERVLVKSLADIKRALNDIPEEAQGGWNEAFKSFRSYKAVNTPKVIVNRFGGGWIIPLLSVKRRGKSGDTPRAATTTKNYAGRHDQYMHTTLFNLANPSQGREAGKVTDKRELSKAKVAETSLEPTRIEKILGQFDTVIAAFFKKETIDELETHVAPIPERYPGQGREIAEKLFNDAEKLMASYTRRVGEDAFLTSIPLSAFTKFARAEAATATFSSATSTTERIEALTRAVHVKLNVEVRFWAANPDKPEVSVMSARSMANAAKDFLLMGAEKTLTLNTLRDSSGKLSGIMVVSGSTYAGTYRYVEYIGTNPMSSNRAGETLMVNLAKVASSLQQGIKLFSVANAVKFYKKLGLAKENPADLDIYGGPMVISAMDTRTLSARQSKKEIQEFTPLTLTAEGAAQFYNDYMRSNDTEYTPLNQGNLPKRTDEQVKRWRQELDDAYDTYGSEVGLPDEKRTVSNQRSPSAPEQSSMLLTRKDKQNLSKYEKLQNNELLDLLQSKTALGKEAASIDTSLNKAILISEEKCPPILYRAIRDLRAEKLGVHVGMQFQNASWQSATRSKQQAVSLAKNGTIFTLLTAQKFRVKVLDMSPYASQKSKKEIVLPKNAIFLVNQIIIGNDFKPDTVIVQMSFPEPDSNLIQQEQRDAKNGVRMTLSAEGAAQFYNDYMRSSNLEYKPLNQGNLPKRTDKQVKRWRQELNDAYDTYGSDAGSLLKNLEDSQLPQDIEEPNTKFTIKSIVSRAVNKTVKNYAGRHDQQMHTTLFNIANPSQGRSTDNRNNTERASVASDVVNRANSLFGFDDWGDTIAGTSLAPARAEQRLSQAEQRLSQFDTDHAEVIKGKVVQKIMQTSTLNEFSAEKLFTDSENVIKSYTQQVGKDAFLTSFRHDVFVKIARAEARSAPFSSPTLINKRATMLMNVVRLKIVEELRFWESNPARPYSDLASSRSMADAAKGYTLDMQPFYGMNILRDSSGKLSGVMVTNSLEFSGKYQYVEYIGTNPMAANRAGETLMVNLAKAAANAQEGIRLTSVAAAMMFYKTLGFEREDGGLITNSTRGGPLELSEAGTVALSARQSEKEIRDSSKLQGSTSARKYMQSLINPKTKENDGRFGADLILGLLAYRRRLAAQ